jgi:hypothetical protein
MTSQQTTTDFDSDLCIWRIAVRTQLSQIQMSVEGSYQISWQVSQFEFQVLHGEISPYAYVCEWTVSAIRHALLPN